MTILGMILVNNPGDWGHLYGPVAHADWHGWTPTDLIFPFFLFIVGTAMAYALRKYRLGASLDRGVYVRILRRTALLLLLGLLLNSAGGWMGLLVGKSPAIEWSTLRLPGVLQRIALAYLLGSLLVLHTSLRTQGVVAVAILLGYWGLLARFPSPTDYEANLSATSNVVRSIDIAVLGTNHMYTQSTSEPTEPEGLLSTLPAVVNVLLGYWVGLWTQRCPIDRRLCWQLFVAGLLVAVLGLIWDQVLPINKKIWTSSFVLLTGGLATSGLAICLATFDAAGWSRLARPWEIVGQNAIFAFVASGLVGRLLTLIELTRADGSAVTLKQWVFDHWFTSWISPPELASLAFAVVTVGIWWAILAGMARFGWTLRV
jgi:predicted acyltransferase